MRSLLLATLIILTTLSVQGQTDSSSTQKEEPSKFDEFNKKAERLFTILPVPLYSYSTEAGHIFGLAKYNLIRLDRRDTISQPSKISELITLSTLGRIKVALTTDLIWNENKWMVLGYIYYKEQNEYIFGIGNDVTRDDVEEYSYKQFKFVNTMYRRTIGNLYLGLGFDISNYTEIDYDSTGFLGGADILGTEPVTNFGFSLAGFIDERENRYNPHEGYFAAIQYTGYLYDLNNERPYSKTKIDVRKYFNPWHKHVIALQATTTFCTGEVPFYDLAFMGGDSEMRGYYQGAFRDNVLVDGQIEYRMPVWSIFGLTGWMGAGRVANSYSDLAINDVWVSYGLGLRLMVDSKNQTNLRFDFGFGENGISGFYINFAEAF